MQNIAPQFPFQGYDWSDAQFMGQGSFGKVYKVLKLSNRQQVAVKQIDMVKIDTQYLFDSLVNQMNIMREVVSPNTVRLFDSNVGKNFSYMILQLCDSDLQKKMQNSVHKVSETQCLYIFAQIVKGMKVLADHSYIHRDIKPANVLIRNNVYKIADYGFARKADFYGRQRLDQICGTPIFMAPQLLLNQTYTTKCDIWSLGLMLYQMIFGCTPWPCLNLQSYIQGIMTRPLSFPYNQPIGEHTKDFLIRALCVNQDLRMTWDQLFNHQIVRSHNKGQNVQRRSININIQQILSRIQYEVQIKQINLHNIFYKYQQFYSLDRQRFFDLLFEISPAITTHQTNTLFQFCDQNKNGLVQSGQFKKMFCILNFHQDPVLTHYLQELVCLLQVRKIDPLKLFNTYDKNHTGSLDYQQFRNFILQIGPRYNNKFVQDMYKIFDKDGTGFIDRKQFISTVTRTMKNGDNINIQRAKRNAQGLKRYLIQNNVSGQKFMNFCDKNMDSNISLQQFIHVMEKISYGITLQQTKWIFSCIDSDNSGHVSLQEVLRFIHM